MGAQQRWQLVNIIMNYSDGLSAFVCTNFVLRRSFRRNLAAAMVAAFAMQPAVAGTDDGWQNKAYPYVVVQSDLASVIEDFGRNTGVPVRVSDEVRGEVRGEIPALTARLFLDRLAREHDLVWYYDGFVIDISTRGELRTEVMDATGVSVDRIEREIMALGVYDERFDIRGSERTGLIFISGPPRYVELVRQTLGRLRDMAARPVQVIRGSSGGQSAPGLKLNSGVIE